VRVIPRCRQHGVCQGSVRGPTGVDVRVLVDCRCKDFGSNFNALVSLVSDTRLRFQKEVTRKSKLTGQDCCKAADISVKL
jgi:hypothetical protein